MFFWSKISLVATDESAKGRATIMLGTDTLIINILVFSRSIRDVDI